MVTDLADQIRQAQSPTRLDRWIGVLSPSLSSSRVKARVDHVMRMHLSERFAAYEAADDDRLRGERWLVSKLSSNDQLQCELETLVDRALDLYRNDVYAASAINGRVDNVVGTGIRPQSRVQPKRGVVTPAQAEQFNVTAERLFAQWSEATNFDSQQRQLERSNGIYGESYLAHSDDEQPGSPVTLLTQVINPQRIPYVAVHQKRGRRRLGIELDGRNRASGYWVRRGHPNDSHEADQREDLIGKERLLHSFEEVFPGQLRGVPWLSPAMGRLKDLKDFAHAHLTSEQVAACHSAFVKGVTDPMLLAESARKRSDLEDLSPASIQYLSEGEDIVFSDPARPGTTLAPYMQWALHGIAAALRYPYELLCKEFTNNFSGGRLALIDGRVTFKVWQHNMIRSQLRPTWAVFIDQCVYQGAFGNLVDILNYEQNRAHFLQHQWIPPGWPWVDPEKEVKADILAIEAGLQTETESLAQRGRDFDETLAQREREAIAKAESDKRIADKRAELGLTPVVPQPAESEPSEETADAPA